MTHLPRDILLLLIAAALLLCPGCRSDDDDGSSPTNPVVEVDPQENADLTASVATAARAIIETRIEESVAAEAYINPAAIAGEIASIPGVESAGVNPYATSVSARLTDGSYTNFLLVDWTDERLWETVGSPNACGGGAQMHTLVSPDPHAFEFPTGGEALILAPYQYQVNQDLHNLRVLFDNAGLSVAMYEDDEADLDKFRGDYLDDHDAVLIVTHGAALLRTTGGALTAALVTGEEVSGDRSAELIDEGLFDDVAVGNGHYCFTVPFLNNTHPQFEATWVYACACESSVNDAGPTSFVQAFLNHGAGAFTGYDGSINTLLAKAITERLIAGMTSGVSLSESMDRIRNDTGLQIFAWILRLLLPNDEEPMARVSLLDSDQRLAEDYFLFDPDQIVGTAEVIPPSGPVGTPVVYEVTIGNAFVSQVAYVEFDIDNTGEHFALTQISATLWRSMMSLTAPIAESYPRVDTFTFTAYDPGFVAIGHGSATFTITGEGDAVTNPHRNYHAALR